MNCVVAAFKNVWQSCRWSDFGKSDWCPLKTSIRASLKQPALKALSGESRLTWRLWWRPWGEATDPPLWRHSGSLSRRRTPPWSWLSPLRERRFPLPNVAQWKHFLNYFGFKADLFLPASSVFCQLSCFRFILYFITKNEAERAKKAQRKWKWCD